MLYELLAVGQVFLLGVALPLAVVAVRGYEGTPFGRVLRPLPVVVLGFLVTVTAKLLPLGAHETYYVYAVGNTIGTAAALVSAVRLVLLLTQRRAI